MADKTKSYVKRDRHARNIAKAAEDRRTKTTFQVPMNAMVELASLPARARDKIISELPEEIHVNTDFTTGPENDKRPLMVSDPRRGTKLKGRQLSDALARRAEQAHKIAAKAQQRRNFARLKPAQKTEHRAAGREHRKPRV